jgi:hypothetical protein
LAQETAEAQSQTHLVPLKPCGVMTMLKDDMPKDWVSPGEAIKKFTAELPDTIRDAVLMGCITAFFEPSLERLLEFKSRGLEDFNSILDDVRPRKRAAECAKLIGVMELVLVHSEGGEKFYKEVARETGEKLMHQMATRRFERAVDVVAKSPPQHRTKSVTPKRKKAQGRKGGPKGRK